MTTPLQPWTLAQAAAVAARAGFLLMLVGVALSIPTIGTTNAGTPLQNDGQDWPDAASSPQTEPYDRLQMALEKYQAIADTGGWASLPAKMPAKGQRRAAFVAALRTRLAAEADLEFDGGSPTYDEDLREAVGRFQERNGLRVDGKVDAKTIQRLNIPAADRVSQIKLNMERHRTSLRDVPSTRVEVNAPAATATFYRDGLAQLEMNAVVGAPGHDTPTLSSEINTVIINPTWTVPKSIIEKEIRPLLKKNPDYLTENRMFWSGDQLVQEAGPHNALGQIKFEFPNQYSVYLHDTPAKRLFTDPERAQSHGCVRLERPLDLAEELLRDDSSWSREAIEEAIRAGETQRITLNESMPVVITYLTAFVTDAGVVNFRPDIYGLDAQLKLAGSQDSAATAAEPP